MGAFPSRRETCYNSIVSFARTPLIFGHDSFSFKTIFTISPSNVKKNLFATL